MNNHRSKHEVVVCRGSLYAIWGQSSLPSTNVLASIEKLDSLDEE